MENDTSEIKGTLKWIMYILVAFAVVFAIDRFNLIQPRNKGINLQQCEYKIEFWEDELVESYLNSNGREGWQVVGSRRATSSSSLTDEYGYEFILMREK